MLHFLVENRDSHKPIIDNAKTNNATPIVRTHSHTLHLATIRTDCLFIIVPGLSVIRCTICIDSCLVLPQLCQVNLERLRVVLEAKTDHGVKDVLASDRLALFHLALLCGSTRQRSMQIVQRITERPGMMMNRQSVRVLLRSAVCDCMPSKLV